MNAGRLNKRLTITKITRSKTAGDITKSESSLGTVWAEVKPLTGRNAFYASQIHPEATHQIRIRYLSTLDYTCKLTDGTTTYNIVGIPVNPDGRKKYHLITAKEVL